MKCKQTFECERTYFYQALFGSSRFPGLPRLCSSQSLEVRSSPRAAAGNKGEGRGAELLKPPPRRLGRVKSLHEMPGPNTLYNLYEFFWKDGFGRIHEIQVQLPRLLNALVTPGLLKPFLSSPRKALVNRRVSSTATGHRRAAFPLGRAEFRGSPLHSRSTGGSGSFVSQGIARSRLPVPRCTPALPAHLCARCEPLGRRLGLKEEEKKYQGFFFFFTGLFHKPAELLASRAGKRGLPGPLDRSTHPCGEAVPAPGAAPAPPRLRRRRRCCPSLSPARAAPLCSETILSLLPRPLLT